MTENGVELQLTAVYKKTDFRIAYWQARYSFNTGPGGGRWHGITIGFHPSEEVAEGAALM